MRQDTTQAEFSLCAFVAMILPGLPHKGDLAPFPLALTTPPVIQLLQVCDCGRPGSSYLPLCLIAFGISIWLCLNCLALAQFVPS